MKRLIAILLFLITCISVSSLAESTIVERQAEEWPSFFDIEAAKNYIEWFHGEEHVAQLTPEHVSIRYSEEESAYFASCLFRIPEEGRKTLYTIRYNVYEGYPENIVDHATIYMQSALLCPETAYLSDEEKLEAGKKAILAHFDKIISDAFKKEPITFTECILYKQAGNWTDVVEATVVLPYFCFQGKEGDIVKITWDADANEIIQSLQVSVSEYGTFPREY